MTWARLAVWILAVALVAATVWWLRPPDAPAPLPPIAVPEVEAPAPPARPATPALPPSALPAPRSEPAPRAATRSQELANRGPGKREEPDGRPPTETGALQILIVDPAGAPVASIPTFTLRGSHGIEACGTLGGRACSIRLPRLEPGAWFIDVEAPGYLNGSLQAEVRPGATTEVVLRLDPSCEVAGLVVDHRGARLPGVRVWARRAAVRERSSRGNATTDADGRFRIQGLNASLHELHCEPDGYDAVTVQVTPVGAPGVPETTIVIPRRGVVTARLRLPSGFPPPNRVLVIGPVAQGSTEEGASSLPWENGLVEVEDLPVGPVQLRFLVKGLAAVTRTLQMPAGGRVDLGEIAFELGLSLEGQVLDLRGVPVPGATVSAGVSHPASFQTAVSAPDGTFRVERLAEGAVELRIEAEGFLPARAGANVRPGAEPVTVRLERGGLIKGEVRCEVGAAAPSTFVNIEGPAGLVRSLWSDREGRFLARLAPGSYRVSTTKGWVVSAGGGAVLRKGSEPQVRVELREGEETPASLRIHCLGRR